MNGRPAASPASRAPSTGVGEACSCCRVPHECLRRARKRIHHDSAGTCATPAAVRSVNQGLEGDFEELTVRAWPLP